MYFTRTHKKKIHSNFCASVINLIFERRKKNAFHFYQLYSCNFTIFSFWICSDKAKRNYNFFFCVLNTFIFHSVIVCYLSVHFFYAIIHHPVFTLPSAQHHTLYTFSVFCSAISAVRTYRTCSAFCPTSGFVLECALDVQRKKHPSYWIICIHHSFDLQYTKAISSSIQMNIKLLPKVHHGSSYILNTLGNFQCKNSRQRTFVPLVIWNFAKVCYRSKSCFNFYFCI